MESRPPETSRSLGYRSYVLAVLVLVYTFNFIDRQIVGILAVPIKKELALTDSQLGIMGGLAFALFYTFLGIPIARLADRANRVRIMTFALALWSMATAACGMTHTFVQLFLARLGVGVGEAGGVAPAYSLICDYFPKSQRARALGVYSFGIPLGSALGIVAGGFITHWMSWRMAFAIVGLAGLILAPLLRMTVKEPVRGGLDGAQSLGARPALAEVITVLVSKPSFWGLSLGAASASMMGYGLFFWMPSFLVRSFGLTLVQASLYYGALILVGGVAGIWLGSVMADRYGTSRKGAYALIPAIAFVGTLPFYVGGVLSSSIEICMAISLIPTALGLMWLGPILTAVQHIVPSTMRATASALFLFINNLIGIGVGTTLIGVLSDAFQVRGAGVQSLRYAILAGTGFYVVAALFLFFAARHLAADWDKTVE